MKFDKDFNPGSGNTYNEWNIQHVENFNPNATSVITVHYHYGEEKVASGGRKRMDDEQKQAIKNEILDYVGQLTDFVNSDWKTRYATLWNKILDLPAVEAVIYDYGRQRNTHFNKYVLGNIIHMLMGKVLKGNATDLCKALEGDEKHHIRQEMGYDPAEEIRSAVSALFNIQNVNNLKVDKKLNC